MLRIEHNRKLLGPLGVLTRHDRARMRSVRNSARMQRDRGRLDSATRPEITAHIKQNFVGFDVIVDPRNFYRFGMGIEKTRRERADNVSANLKRLMDRGRLMNRAGDRFEILGVKRERINVSIPADNI